MTPIAIRLFENAKYGSTYGAGLRRSAVYNATAEITEPYAKYLLDFEPGPAWINHARTEDQLATVRRLIDQVERDQEVLWSWVKWYDRATGDKQSVAGFAAYDMASEEIALHVRDAQRGITEEWLLPARRCQATAGRNTPAFLATNHDLT